MLRTASPALAALAALALALALVALFCLSATAAAAEDAPESAVFSLFEDSCMAFAGDNLALKAWADLNMRTVAPRDEDKMFKTFKGRWAGDRGGAQAELQLLDPPWVCTIETGSAHGPALQARLTALHDKLKSSGHYKVVLRDRSAPEAPSETRRNMEVFLGDDENLLFKFTTAAKGAGPARLQLYKAKLPQPVKTPPAKQAASIGAEKSAGDKKQQIDPDKLAAVLMGQIGVAAQYKQDKDKITQTAVNMFKDGCVDHFGAWKELAQWADAHMSPAKDDPYAAALGDKPAGIWAHDIRHDARLYLSFSTVPGDCLLRATNSYADITHNEMKLMAGRLSKGGTYKAHYKGRIVNPQTGTLYSVILLEPADGGPALQILASTNTKLGRTSVFSIGYPGQ